MNFVYRLKLKRYSLLEFLVVTEISAISELTTAITKIMGNPNMEKFTV